LNPKSFFLSQKWLPNHYFPKFHGSRGIEREVDQREYLKYNNLKIYLLLSIYTMYMWKRK